MESTRPPSADESSRVDARLLEVFRICPAALAINRWYDATYVDVNAAFSRLLGWTRDELIGRTTMELNVVATDAFETLRTKLDADRSVRDFEMTITTRSGMQRNVLVSCELFDLNNERRVISSFVDITDRRREEETRRASEARYRALFDYAPDGLLIADANSFYLDANASACNMLGYTHKELVGLHASDIVVQSERKFIGPALEAITSNANYHREWVFRRKDGTEFPAEVIGAMMPDKTLLGMLRDVTERTRIEGRFRRLVDSNAQGVMFWSNSGPVTSANDAFLKIIGYPREDLEAGLIDWAKITPAEFAPRDKHALEEIAAAGVCTPYEKEYIRRDGTHVPILIGAASFADNPNEGVSFVLDLSDKKKLEQQFFRAQRLESVGTLAGGIAHDLNNVLAPILLSVGVLRSEVKDEQLTTLIDTIQRCAQRGADLVQQVLSFARGVEGRHVLVNLEHLLRDVLKVVRDTFPRSVDVRLDANDDVWNINADPTQINQVFMNLAINARDAMVAGGHLSVTVENVVLDATYAAMNIDARPGEYVRVTVADTGAGIPPEVRDRIFEPFFTTKEVGKGTGLGLSTSLAIVKSHGGFIHVYSEVGQGTKFKVYLPASTTAVAANSVAVEQSGLPRGNGELVMVVDDEAAIRDIAKTTLERFGYRVMPAANGAEAVALFAVNRDDIAVVLTDMAMPVMDGPSTIIALKSIDPSVKIIGSSGLASNDGVAKAVGAGVQHFVPKPYTAETLLKTLAVVLDPTSTARL